MTASGARSAGTITVVAAASGIAVHVGGPVQQLGGGDALRDQPEKGQLDVAAAQHRARVGVLETCRWVIERVDRQATDGRAPRCSSSCCGCPIHSAPVDRSHAAQVHPGIIT